MTDIIKREQPEPLTPAAPVRLDLRSHPEDETLALKRIVQRLLRRKHYVAIVLVLVLVPAAIATYLATPLYRSTALVQVNPDPVQVLPYRDVADTAPGGANFENYMGTQEQILKGPGLRQRVAARLAELKDDPTAAAEAAELDDRFSLKKIEKSQLFELSYQAASPEAAATVVNLYAQEFIKQNFEMRQATRVKAEQQLKEELNTLEKRLQMSENDLTAYAQANDILSREQGQVDPLQQRLSILTQQLAESEGSVAVARSSHDMILKASIEEFPQRLMSDSIAQLQARLLQLEQELATLRGRFGANWPAVIEKRNEAELVRDQLVREKATVLAHHQEQTRLDLVAAQTRRQMAANALAEQKALVNQFHDASIKYNILKREVDTNRNLYDGLLERLRQTGVMAGFQFGNIQLVEPGRPNPRVDSPKVLWTLGLAALLGLALGVGLVLLSDTWDTSISTPEEAEQLVPFPTLGSMPLMKAPKVPARLNGSSGGSSSVLKELTARVPPPKWDAVPFEVTESMRGICASLLLSRSDQSPRVIVVTSAVPGEGKTTIVSHLARAFAEAGLKTLLVEADLRKPDLSRSFAIEKEEGLSLYLAGLVSAQPKIHSTDNPALFVASGGPIPPNPAALLHSDRLREFLKKAASEYEVVILDTPPVLSIADARIVATRADGVVLVVRAGRTSRNLVRRAWTMLESSGGNVLGMVLNGWQPGREELSHYYYYHPNGQRDAKSA